MIPVCCRCARAWLRSRPGPTRLKGSFIPAAKRCVLLSLFVVFAATAANSYCHELQYEVQAGPPMVLHFFFPDNSKFSYENFEIRAPGEAAIFQKGRTDRLGRVALLPERPGIWHVRVFSEDGHGADVEVNVGPNQTVTNYSRSLFDRYSRVFVGAGFIFGFFGLLILIPHLYKKRITHAKNSSSPAMPPHSPLG